MLICVGSRLRAAFAVGALLTSVMAAAAAEKVSVGITSASTDIGLFIADAKGYFKEEGIEVSFTPFDSAARMIGPLGAGQLDVGGGAASSGLYNAVERGIKLKIVADKGRNAPGYAFQSFMVRTTLFEKGEVKALKDLKGRKVAIVAPASSDASVLNEAMKSAGLTFYDVEKVYLGFPQQIVAFQNGAIDAAITTEPTVTALIRAGAAVKLTGNDAFYPNHQTAVILYGGEFVERRAEIGTRFMKAYVRALRDYNDALQDGRLAGKGAEAIVDIHAKYSNIKDRETIRAMTPHGSDPNGAVNVESLKKDLEFFKAQGQVKGDLSIEKVLDTSFLDAALKQLGPYKPAGL